MSMKALAPVVCLAAALTVSLAAQAERSLVPVLGPWTSGTEAGGAIWTINGAAPAVAPHAAAIQRLFGANASAAFLESAGAATGFPLAIAETPAAFSKGRVTLEFKLIGGASDQTAGVAFDVRPDGSYAFARYNTKDGNVAVWKFENGARTVLKHGDLHEQLPFNQWHTLDVTIDGAAVSAKVNNTLTVSHTMERPVNGRVGVWTKADSVTAFRKLRIQ